MLAGKVMPKKVEAVQARSHTTVHSVEQKLNRGGNFGTRINYLQAKLDDVIKIRRSGRYCGRTSCSQ